MKRFKKSNNCTFGFVNESLIINNNGKKISYKEFIELYIPLVCNGIKIDNIISIPLYRSEGYIKFTIEYKYNNHLFTNHSLKFIPPKEVKDLEKFFDDINKEIYNMKNNIETYYRNICVLDLNTLNFSNSKTEVDVPIEYVSITNYKDEINKSIDKIINSVIKDKDRIDNIESIANKLNNIVTDLENRISNIESLTHTSGKVEEL